MRGRGQINGVAVGLCVPDGLGGQQAVGAGAVFDHYRHPQLGGKLLGEGARHDIGGAAGCKPGYQGDRLGWVIGRHGQHGHQCGQAGKH
ncbi:Uncharacterised protein [Bordetella pertussis]|nr:Uncharacterised protein [Bordetella pertussis]CFP62875.1 Uncharacterised protein [Bordetella pertussis]